MAALELALAVACRPSRHPIDLLGNFTALLLLLLLPLLPAPALAVP